jgi:hypothetical protein
VRRSATEQISYDTISNGKAWTRTAPKRKSKNTAPAESGRKEDNMKIDTNKYYIVRGDRSGVFFGKINYQVGKEVQMNDVRCLWYWDGAASIIELAISGTKKPNNCKFTVAVEEITITDAIEIIPCSEKATAIIKAVEEWRA